MNFLKTNIMMCILTILTACSSKAQKEPVESIYDVKINDASGKKIDLASFKGKKILFVNVASKCGFTKQYDGLEKLYKKYADKLVVIGLPCNQFGGQEPGTNSEIQSFCRTTFGVDFPITEKIEVKGSNQHPIYQWLTQKSKNGMKNSSVKWNFQKYLVDEKGNFINFWHSTTKPMSSKITTQL